MSQRIERSRRHRAERERGQDQDALSAGPSARVRAELMNPLWSSSATTSTADGAMDAPAVWSAARRQGTSSAAFAAHGAALTAHLKRADTPSTPSPDAEARLKEALSRRGGSSRPPLDIQRAVETHVGPLGEVRIHTGSEASALAHAFGARALTVGKDVFFGMGEYDPGSERGAKLLAHELTHVAQGAPQRAQAGVQVAPGHAPTERHADVVAERVGAELRAPHAGGWAGLAAEWLQGGSLAAPTSAGAAATPSAHGGLNVALQRRETEHTARNMDSVRVGEGTKVDEATAFEDRKRFVNTYRDWMLTRVREVKEEQQNAQLRGNKLNDRVEGLLSQMEQLARKVRQKEETPDIKGLNSRPSKEEPVSSGGVPPEWIEPARQLIAIIEQNGPATGEDAPTGTTAEGSRFNATDWNSRLGVPQYRTQSDNLASPEATCNVTSFAMASERLGIGREAVVKAIDKRLKVDNAATPDQASEVWKPKVKTYLQAEMKRGSAYQRLRGQASVTASTIDTWASTFRATAQLEDLYSFLASQQGTSRTSLVSGGAQTMFDEVTGTEPANRVTTEMLSSAGKWEDLSKKVNDTLSKGGAAFFSLHHKGKGRSGTHIVTIQRVTADGFVLDDPYGAIREGYTRGKRGDAYAPTGQTARTGTYKNAVDRTTTDDWKTTSSQTLTTAESKGDSHFVSKETVLSAFNYIRLVRRPDPTEQQRVAGNAATPQHAPGRK